MSETATIETPAPVVAATPAAPATPVAPATTAPAPTPAGPLARREARQAVLADRKEAEDKKPAAPAVAPANGSTDTPVATDGTPATTPAPAEAPKPTSIRVEIGAEHPATRGRAVAITVSSPEEEQILRTLVNGTYYRVKDVAERDAKIAELQQKIVRQESGEAATKKWMQSPEYKAAVQRYGEIKESVGEEAANDYWAGQQSKFAALADQEFSTRMGAIDEQKVQAAATAWKTEAWRMAGYLPEPVRSLPQFTTLFEEAVHSFNAEIELGHYPALQNSEDAHQEFKRFFGARLIREPDVTAALRRAEEESTKRSTAAAGQAAAAERERKAIADKAVDDFKKSMGDKRTTNPPNPLGNLGGAARDRTPPSGPAGSNGQDTPAAQNVHDLRRQQRDGARQDGRRYTT